MAAEFTHCFIINDTHVLAKNNKDFNADEAAAYYNHVRETAPNNNLSVQKIELDFGTENPEEVAIKTTYGSVPRFERIRRITGYLVGSLDRWNDGKRAEESDRIGHSM